MVGSAQARDAERGDAAPSRTSSGRFSAPIRCRRHSSPDARGPRQRTCASTGNSTDVFCGAPCTPATTPVCEMHPECAARSPGRTEPWARSRRMNEQGGSLMWGASPRTRFLGRRCCPCPLPLPLSAFSARDLPGCSRSSTGRTKHHDDGPRSGGGEPRNARCRNTAYISCVGRISRLRYWLPIAAHDVVNLQDEDRDRRPTRRGSWA